jgi:hypothetical protein
MREKLPEAKLALDLYERLDAMSMSDIERLRAKAALERAEHVADVIARAAGGVKKLVRAGIVRPIKRALATVRRYSRSCRAETRGSTAD